MIPELSSEFEHSIVPMLANHLWQSTVVLCLAGLLTLALRRNQARVRYWLWMVASVKFLVPFSLLIGLGSHLHTVGGTRTLAGPRAGIYAVVNQAEQPFSQPIVVPPVVARESSLHDVLTLLPAVVWLCGSLAIVCLWVVRWRRVRKMVREAVPMEAGREMEALLRVSAAAGLRRPVPLLRSQARMEPGIFGIWRPVLLWPAGISEHLEDAHIEAILAHEMQHVRRRDNLAALLHMAVEALFWFHPLVWLAGARLVEERERACDEDVLLAGGRPHVYAGSILKTCQFCLESPPRCVSGITGADLKGRIAGIMAKRGALKLGFGRKALLVAAGAIAVAVPVVLGQANASQNKAQMESGDVSFEVATIKPSPPSSTRDGDSSEGRHFELHSSTVLYMMTIAYGIQAKQIVNAPGWLMTDKYDISAIMPEGADKKQITGMIRRLLAERFGLKFHRERRETSAYVIKVDKGGIKMEKNMAGPEEGRSFQGRGMGHLTVRNGRVADFAGWLNSGVLDRPVVDETSLADKYNFALNWMPDSSQYGGMGGMVRPPADGAEALPGLFTAVQEQLGLKLEPTKANVDVLVIDHVERPSEN